MNLLKNSLIFEQIKKLLRTSCINRFRFQHTNCGRKYGLSKVTFTDIHISLHQFFKNYDKLPISILNYHEPVGGIKNT